MEEKELREIEAREKEQAKKNIDEMIQTGTFSDIWLLYKDKFDLDKKKTCTAVSVKPTQLLIPIYEKVLLPIYPCPSYDGFKHLYGFSIDQVMEWKRKGWVETLLPLPHVDYVDVSYMDELISSSPSSSSRNEWYTLVLSGDADKFFDALDKGQTIFERVKGPVPEWLVDALGERRLRENLSRILATAYGNLSVFRLARVIKIVEELADNNSDIALVATLYASSFLTSPFLYGLRGTTVYGSNMKDVAAFFYRMKKARDKPFFVPCWFADIYENLGTTIPQTTDTDEIGAVRKHSEGFVRAVKSLDEEIDEAVKEKFKGGELGKSEEETIKTKKQEFYERWCKDVAPAFEDISKTERIWSITLAGSIVAPIVALAAMKDVLTVPASLLSIALGADKIKKLVDPAAEFLSTFFECNPIHLGFYKVHRELKKVKQEG